MKAAVSVVVFSFIIIVDYSCLMYSCKRNQPSLLLFSLKIFLTDDSNIYITEQLLFFTNFFRCSLILPLSWVKAFWITFVSNGAHAIGLREKHWVAGEVSYSMLHKEFFSGPPLIV